MHAESLKQKVIALRSKGKTYSEINSILGVLLPKSTIATWSRTVSLPEEYRKKIIKLHEKNFHRMREIGDKKREARKANFLKEIESTNEGLFEMFRKDVGVSKIVLTVLYLAEGSKTRRGSLMFGNSDPLIVSLFVDLMRKCYKIDESKFRCTVQCRADQDIKELESFWSKVTKIPLKQFYATRVDKRTIGQPSRKKDYKGVCRIDYFSSAVDLELKHIAKVIMTK